MNSLTATLTRIYRVVLIIGIASFIITADQVTNVGFTFSTPTFQSFTVTNANDQGSGSLREAIVNANATPGPDTIVFNIPGAGVKTISLSTPLPEITGQVVIDATTQPGYTGAPLIELDGLAAGASGSGLVIKAGSSTVLGLAIVNFTSNNGIWLNACDNNTIQANYLGVGANGTTAKSNSRGILLTNSSNNLIGGTTAATRNVISGNVANGIEINGNANIIQGNFIGTNAAGTAALPNEDGVVIPNGSSTNNVIGGTAASAGNLISGNNDDGIFTTGAGTTIQGNLIGTNAAGTDEIPNWNGIQATGTNMLIGGLVAGARNVISGSRIEGVGIQGAGSKLQGNYIGTDITGTFPLGNGFNGVAASGLALVGGTMPEARNIISNSGFANVTLEFNNFGPALVQGNYIGTDVTGTRVFSDQGGGIDITSSGNLIGGLVAGAGNVISGNGYGIRLGGFAAPVAGNVIQGNIIGLNAAGSGPLPNAQLGIWIAPVATNNTIGGTQSGGGNKIAFNDGPGVTAFAGNGNSVRGNSIFSNNGLGIDLGGNGVTSNDISDADTGPNNLQNFPVITGAMSTGNSTTIQGSLKSTPNTTFQIDFYSNSAVDPLGHGEGAHFIGTTPVNTDGNGNATINVTFPVSLPAGRVVTATATDPNGNTSEFSAADSTGAIGSVHFSESSITTLEDVGVLTVTVQRTGGFTGDLTVEYATVDGTAVAGQDYTANSGTFTFTGTESSKTIQIPIANDSTTEPDEVFAVVLRNTSSLEVLGAPNIFVVTVQDSTTVLEVSVDHVSIIEGNPGATTEAVFTITLSAATGRVVSGRFFAVGFANFVDFGAFGGSSCNTQGVDFERISGTFTFNPGATTFTVPVKICGDTSAETDEVFFFRLLDPIGAALGVSESTNTIVNDDVLELVREASGPAPTQAAALDAILAVRDPFRVVGIPDWFPSGSDRNTRVVLFARSLQLNPGELSSAVSVRFITGNGSIFDGLVVDVRSIPNSDLTQVTVRLPDNLPAGTHTVSIRAHGRESNSGTIRIAP
ncbi:MAG TPA: Calx-beta domain-containing protein [Pyrinomonadaceae bacterium]|nr:Calx-beta domain-containing protein [Pyrinomonadaceae bacterium]